MAFQIGQAMPGPPGLSGRLFSNDTLQIAACRNKPRAAKLRPSATNDAATSGSFFADSACSASASALPHHPRRS